MKELLLVYVTVYLFSTGFVNGQDDACKLEEATKCLNYRETQFAQTSSGSSGDPAQSMRTLCLTQVMPDQASMCFDTSTEQCTAGQAEDLKNKWTTLRSQITSECLVECPTMLSIAQCKNITDASRLKFGIFERFCSTFNKSLHCVKSHIDSCNFGMQFYEHMLESNFRQYWAYICKSGCQNIDRTVQVIGDCANHLSEVTGKENLCHFHNKFKECVFNSTEVCSEVMVLVRFKYKRYDLVEGMCKKQAITRPPTTTSTTSTTTRTTTVTTTDEITTETTIPKFDDLTSDLSEYQMLIDRCIEKIDHNNWEIPSELTVDHVLMVLKLESCVYNENTVPEVWKAQLVDHISPEFFAYYHYVKKHGWQYLRDYQTHCKHVSSGSCSAHGDGILSGWLGSSLQGKFPILTALMFWAISLTLYRTNVTE